MHRLNLLRPQERKFFFVFFSSREKPSVCGSALSHIQRKNDYCDVLLRFVIVCCDGGETGGGIRKYLS